MTKKPFPGEGEDWKSTKQHAEDAEFRELEPAEALEEEREKEEGQNNAARMKAYQEKKALFDGPQLVENKEEPDTQETEEADTTSLKIVPDIGEVIPGSEDRLSNTNPSEPRTYKEEKTYLKHLIEKAKNKTSEALDGFPENTSERFKKGAAYCKTRLATLGPTLKEFGLAELKGVGTDLKKFGSKTLDVLANPEAAVKGGVEKAKRIQAYLEYFKNSDDSLKEKGKKLGVDMLALVEAYRKIPFRQKMYLSAALMGGALLAGGASAAAVSIFAAGRYGARSLSALGIYTALEAAGEESISNKEIETQEIRSRLDSWKKHGIATGAALLIASGLPGAAIRDLFVGGEEGVTHLYHAMSGAAAGGHSLTPAESWAASHGHTVAPKVEVPQASTPEAATPHAPAPESLATHTPPTESVTQSQEVTPPPHAEAAATATTAAPEAIPQANSVAVEVRPGRGYEQMARDLYNQLHDPSKHFDTSKVVPGSALDQILKADDHTINGVVHNLAPKEFLDGKVVLEHARMTFNEDGSLHFIQGGVEPQVATESSVAAHAPIPEARPEHVFPPVETRVVPEAPPVHEVPAAAPAPEVPPHASATPGEETITGKQNFSSGRVGDHVQYGKGAHIPLQNAAESHPEPTAPVEVGQHPLVEQGVSIDATHAHQYLGKEGEKIIFGGGSNDERIGKAMDWVRKDHKAEVYFETVTKGMFGRETHHLMRASWAELAVQPAGPMGLPAGPEKLVDNIKIEEIKLPGVRTPSAEDLYKLAE